MSRHPTKIVSSEHLVSDTSAELSELEYALIMALIALIVIIALIATGSQLLNVYSNITATMCNYHVGC